MSNYLASAAIIGGVSTFVYKFYPQILGFLDKRLNGEQTYASTGLQSSHESVVNPNPEQLVASATAQSQPVFASTGVRRRPAARSSDNKEPLNFSITLDETLLFSVKPLPKEQQSFLYDIAEECYTAVLIKRNPNNNYDFIFAKFNGSSSEDRNILFTKIEKIIFRLFLFNILQDEEYILVTINCDNDRSALQVDQHRDYTIDFQGKIQNRELAVELRQIVQKPTFVMCEYKTQCMSAEYNIERERFRCAMNKAQILCFNNIPGTHGTPGSDLPGVHMKEGNKMIIDAQGKKIVRKIERYHFSAISKAFYTKYAKSSTMTSIKRDITTVSNTASGINTETEQMDLYSFMQDTEAQQRILRGGNKNKTNKHKSKTNKYKINKYKIKTNKYKKL